MTWRQYWESMQVSCLALLTHLYRSLRNWSLWTWLYQDLNLVPPTRVNITYTAIVQFLEQLSLFIDIAQKKNHFQNSTENVSFLWVVFCIKKNYKLFSFLKSLNDNNLQHIWSWLTRLHGHEYYFLWYQVWNKAIFTFSLTCGNIEAKFIVKLMPKAMYWASLGVFRIIFL